MDTTNINQAQFVPKFRKTFFQKKAKNAGKRLLYLLFFTF